MKNVIEAGYCTEFPSPQTAIDIFRDNWKSAFPEESGLVGGSAPNFEDKRVYWADKTLGGMRGKSVLELGPYEAYNTWQFWKLGCSPVVAVEGNNVNFLKCLVAKEALGIDARFLFGDILSYLQRTDERFDICWASGVLYHQVQPLELLQAMARVAPRLFVWTHFHDDIISENPEAYPLFEPEGDETRTLDGFECRHHRRSYRLQSTPIYFSGGNEPHAFWLRKEDIFAYLEQLGFPHITVNGINPSHPAGPTISFIASRADA